MRASLAVVVIACVLAGALPTRARAWRLEWEAGISAATGEYGSDWRTTTGWLTNDLVLHTGPIVLRGTVPVVLQDSPTAISSAGLPLPRRPSPSWTRSDTLRTGEGPDSVVIVTYTGGRADGAWRAEVGDPVVSLGFAFPGGNWSPAASVSAKAPVTGTNGFGTGEWDVWATTTLGRRISTSTLLEATAGYRWCGDPPGIEFEDGWSGSLRWTRERSDGRALLAFLQGSASPLDGFDPPVSIGIAIRQPWLASRAAATFSLSLGLTETAAQVLGGVGWSWRLDRE